jgi:hypothetical protein
MTMNSAIAVVGQRGTCLGRSRIGLGLGPRRQGRGQALFIVLFTTPVPRHPWLLRAGQKWDNTYGQAIIEKFGPYLRYWI